MDTHVMHIYKQICLKILTSSLIECPFSSWILTKRFITILRPGERCRKYLWNPHLTAKEANIVLLTKADRKSVKAPGECWRASSYKCLVIK